MSGFVEPITFDKLWVYYAHFSLICEEIKVLRHCIPNYTSTSFVSVSRDQETLQMLCLAHYFKLNTGDYYVL